MIGRRQLLAGACALAATPAKAFFSSNGINQQTADLALRPQPLRGADATTLAGRTQVDPSTLAGAINIIFIGQSTNNNSINSTASPANPTKLFNLSIAHKGACFQALEPLLSADLLQGHGGMYLGDKLVTDGKATKVLLTNISIGGSYCADWNPAGGTVGGIIAPGAVFGEEAYRIGLAARCIANSGLSGLKTVIDWQQGEWDSDPTATTQANYTAALNGVIAEFKRVGLLRSGNVMFINQCTRITSSDSAGRTAIRAAQAAVCDGGLVRLGGDMDTILAANRYDGTHFSASGAVLQAGLKATGIENYITNG